MTLDFDKIDKVIHERGRLAIMTLLATRVRWPFADLKSELKMSDGNLITHLRTLHQAGYVAVDQGNARPSAHQLCAHRTRPAGFHDYLALLEQIIKTGQG